VSSFDLTGRNRDSWRLPAGETATIFAIATAGIIRRIWFTTDCLDPMYPRKVVLRMYWDGQEHPSVECPIGDFFGVGHAEVTSYQSAVMNMSSNWRKPWKAASMNCFWPMPFATKARITIENQCDQEMPKLFFHVDYDELDQLSDDELRFHAWWNRDNPDPTPESNDDREAVNLSDENNYVLVEATGRGHFLGGNISVHNLHGGWWGEGDDMVMIDGQTWPPDMHGTGTEEWFHQAWGTQPDDAFLYAGVSYHNGLWKEVDERTTAYSYHVLHPIIFSESIRVSIERGHANNRFDDWSSTAYWYQTLPSIPFGRLPSASERLPRPDVLSRGRGQPRARSLP
jgi:hypothetical protein